MYLGVEVQAASTQATVDVSSEGDGTYTDSSFKTSTCAVHMREYKTVLSVCPMLISQEIVRATRWIGVNVL